MFSLYYIFKTYLYCAWTIRNVCILRYPRTSFGESYASYHIVFRDDDYFDAVEDKIPMQDIIPKAFTWPTWLSNCGFWKTDNLCNYTFFSIFKTNSHFVKKKKKYHIKNNLNLNQLHVLHNHDISCNCANCLFINYNF